MEIVLMNDNTIKPTRADLDLYSSIDVDIEVGSIKKVKYWNLYISSKNSYGSKGLLTLGGVIDKDCTGEIIIIINKGFGEMDKIFKYFGMYNYKTQ